MNQSKHNTLHISNNRSWKPFNLVPIYKVVWNTYVFGISCLNVAATNFTYVDIDAAEEICKILCTL